MSFTPADSAIRLTAEDEQKIATMLPDEIKIFMREKAVANHLIELDPYSGDPIPLPLSENAPQRFAKTLVIGSQRIIIEANSPDELERNVASAQRVADELSKPAKAEVPPRDSAGRFTPAPTPDDTDEAAVATRADLELKFKRGEISTDEYLSQSGAVERRLRDIGVDIESLQQQSWERATNEFLARHPEWQGGDAAKLAIANAVASLGLEGQPSVATLEKAYNRLLSTQSLPVNPELERQREYEIALSKCKNSSEIHQVTAQYFGTHGSSL